MKILVACEYSGRVRDAFIKRGHEAMSCDLLPVLSGGPHYQGNVMDIIYDGWDLMIAHPPCTYLTCSAEWAYRDVQKKKISEGTLIGKERRQARADAIRFVLDLAGAPIKRIAIENPVGVLSTAWRNPDQYIQPYEYGSDASKKTCLWLKNLPMLKPTKYIEPRIVYPKALGTKPVFRWANQTDSGQNKETPSPDRWKIRSLTYQGWADAFAEQWGELS